MCCHALQARGSDLRVHFKNTRESAAAIRGLALGKAKAYLEAVIAQKRAVPFTRFSGECAAGGGVREEGEPPRQGAGARLSGTLTQRLPAGLRTVRAYQGAVEFSSWQHDDNLSVAPKTLASQQGGDAAAAGPAAAAERRLAPPPHTPGWQPSQARQMLV